MAGLSDSWVSVCLPQTNMHWSLGSICAFLFCPFWIYDFDGVGFCQGSDGWAANTQLQKLLDLQVKVEVVIWPSSFRVFLEVCSILTELISLSLSSADSDSSSARLQPHLLHKAQPSSPSQLVFSTKYLVNSLKLSPVPTSHHLINTVGLKQPSSIYTCSCHFLICSTGCVRMAQWRKCDLIFAILLNEILWSLSLQDVGEVNFSLFTCAA